MTKPQRSLLHGGLAGVVGAFSTLTLMFGCSPATPSLSDGRTSVVADAQTAPDPISADAAPKERTPDAQGPSAPTYPVDATLLTSALIDAGVGATADASPQSATPDASQVAAPPDAQVATTPDAAIPDAAAPDAAPAPGPATHAGLTFFVQAVDPGGFLVLRANDAYSGDTPASAVIPMLCIDKDGSAEPIPYNYDSFYQAWAYAHIELTPPISGTLLTSEAAGDAICAQQFGDGWQMGEFHDGVGWGFGAYPIGDFSAPNFWTAISDQPANPWD